MKNLTKSKVRERGGFEMIKYLRDLSIFILMCHLIAGFWIVIDPAFVGHWQANHDIAYDDIMTEYYSDCDCTESLE